MIFKDFCNVKIDASVWKTAEHELHDRRPWNMTSIQKGTDGGCSVLLMSHVTRVWCTCGLNRVWPPFSF